MYTGEIEPADISGTNLGWHYPYSFVEYWSEKIIQTNYRQLPFDGEWRDMPANFAYHDFPQYLMLRNRAVFHHSEQKRRRDANKLPEGF